MEIFKHHNMQLESSRALWERLTNDLNSCEAVEVTQIAERLEEFKKYLPPKTEYFLAPASIGFSDSALILYVWTSKGNLCLKRVPKGRNLHEWILPSSS